MYVWRVLVVVLFSVVSLADASCDKELQGIIATPESCAKNYLHSLMRQLKTKKRLLFTSEAGSVIRNFE